MAELVKLASARDLVDAGVVRPQDVEVVGQPGGWVVQMQTRPGVVRTLATKKAEARRFSTLESAMKALGSIGLHGKLRVDNKHWQPADLLGARKRPDRAAAMKLKDADARYAAYLRDAVIEAQHDPRPALAITEAAEYMARLKAETISKQASR